QLLAFDLDDEIVARQKFNKPVETCCCVHRKSDDLIANLDSVLADCGFTDFDGIVIWLDYTDPRKIGQQLREFEALLGKLKSGDVVRVTVNAHPSALIDQQVPG